MSLRPATRRPRHVTPAPPAAARGFSLIEAVIAIAVIGVLAAIALPSYSSYIDRGKRAAARQVLLEAAAWLERHYTTFGCYDRASAASCVDRTGAELALPAPLQRAPRDGRPSYALSLAFPSGADCPAGAGQCFTLNATPCGNPAAACPPGSEPFRDTSCNVYALSHTGARSASGSSDLGVCWGR